MDKSTGTTTDDSSIRPVSSLRSHFEQIATHHTNTPRSSSPSLNPSSRWLSPHREQAGLGTQTSDLVSTVASKSKIDPGSLFQRSAGSTKGDDVRDLANPPSGIESIAPATASNPSAMHTSLGSHISTTSDGHLVGQSQLNRTVSTHPPTIGNRSIHHRPSHATNQSRRGDLIIAEGSKSTARPAGKASETLQAYLHESIIETSTQDSLVRPTGIKPNDQHTEYLDPRATYDHKNLRPSSPFKDDNVSPFSTPPSSDDGSPKVRKKQTLERLPYQMQPRSVSQQKAAISVDSIQPQVALSSRDTFQLLPVNGDQFEVHLSHDSGDLNFEEGTVNDNVLYQQRTPKAEQLSYRSFSHRKPPPPPPKRPLPSKFPLKPHAVVSQNAENILDIQASGYDRKDLRPTSSKKLEDVFPDISRTNRNPPYSQAGARFFQISEEVNLIEVCERYVCTAGQILRVFDITTGESLFSITWPEKDTKITAMAFKPARITHDEGSSIWVGTDTGTLQEIDVLNGCSVCSTDGVHERREIVKIHRHQNAMWTIDDSGRLCVWDADDSGLPNLQSRAIVLRLSRGHTCSVVIFDSLWIGHNKGIHIYKPKSGNTPAFKVLESPLSQPRLGIITAATVIGNQPDLVYFGHADGKVSVYSSTKFECLSVITISPYKITSMTGVCSFLWAAFSTGNICVYDTVTMPWKTKKSWLGHRGHSVLGLTMDLGSLWRSGSLHVVSYGSDHCLRIWDGALRNDWLDQYMLDHESAYSSIRGITALVMTWNAGATTPGDLRENTTDRGFFQSLITKTQQPDLLMFGFQELIDLEDKKMTAKTLFKGSKKKDTSEQDHMSHQYRAWRDYLMKCVEDASTPSNPYRILHTASMVGLFSCIFVKSSHYRQVRGVGTGEIKRGMGGLHGNKGAIAVRFIIDDSSICLVNCHLAAGQTQTSSRNTDIANILESELFHPDQESSDQDGIFCRGGDGSMVLDHEVCLLNGDLNYRIDTMGRDAVLRALASNNINKLLERDQLLVSRRRSPTFALRALREAPIQFAPTYKYNVGTDTYDTSEKRRAPAWCDRILYRDSEKCSQTDYLRHDLRISDHRPVTALFQLRVKRVDKPEKVLVKDRALQAYQDAQVPISQIIKVQYLRDILGVPFEEAKSLI